MKTKPGTENTKGENGTGRVRRDRGNTRGNSWEHSMGQIRHNETQEAKQKSLTWGKDCQNKTGSKHHVDTDLIRKHDRLWKSGNMKLRDKNRTWVTGNTERQKTKTEHTTPRNQENITQNRKRNSKSLNEPKHTNTGSSDCDSNKLKQLYQKH